MRWPIQHGHTFSFTFYVLYISRNKRNLELDGRGTRGRVQRILSFHCI